MAKQPQTPGEKLDLKIIRMRGIISRLSVDVPLEGVKWQEHMIAHYTNQLARLIEVKSGLRPTK